MPTGSLHTTRENSITIGDLEAEATYSFSVTAVNEEGRSDPASTPPEIIKPRKLSNLWLYTSLMLTTGLLVMTILSAIFWGHGLLVWRSLFLGFLVLFLGSSILQLLDHKFGIWRPIIGIDRRVSTSQLQTYLWTLLIVFLLSYFTGRTWFDNQKDLFTGFTPGEKQGATIWDDYLILLGGPFTALVAARGIISAKVQNGTVQKSVADDGSAAISQAVTNDAGNVDLVDTQYLLFNLVALTYVIIAFATTDRLPTIPGLLLALTSSSAAAYVLNKSVQNNAPTITSVMPLAARPGDWIVVSGTNFRPAGTAGLPTVAVGGVQALVDASAAPTNARLRAQVPAGVAAGTQSLIVTSAIRVSTDQFQMTVLADKPVILGIEPPVATAGQTTITIEGNGFGSSQDRAADVGVLFGATPVTASASQTSPGLDRVQAQVPPDLPAGQDVDVKIRTPRQTESEPAKLRII